MAFVKETFITKAAYVKRSRKHRFIKPFAALLATVLLCGLTGCNTIVNGLLNCTGNERSEDQKSWDKEKSIPIAQSYLEEKYGEKFTFVGPISVPSYGYVHELVATCSFIRKADEKVEEPTKYKVDVVYEAGEYTVVGDSYMFVHIRKIAEEFLKPYVENCFSDMEHMFFVYRAEGSCGTYYDGFSADAEIPQNIDEVYNILGHTKSIYFIVITPKSEDQDKISEARSILKSDLEDLNLEIRLSGTADTVTDDHFTEYFQSPDPYQYFGKGQGFYSREIFM